MNNNALVSVIIPAYNIEEYLDRCIASVCNQSYSNIEVIVIDDGSTDSSFSICKKWAEKDKRVKAFSNQHKGLSAVRNYGLDKLSGEYIVFVDGDDYIYEDFIKIMLSRLIEDGSDMAICNRLRVGDDSPENYYGTSKYPIKNKVITSDEALRLLGGENGTFYVNAWGKLYKKHLFDNLRFPEGKIHEDVYLAHLVFERCKTVSCVTYAMYYWYLNENSITQRITAESFDVIDAYIERIDYYLKKGMKDGARDSYEALIWNYNNIEKEIEKNAPNKLLLKEYKKKAKKAHLKISLSFVRNNRKSG